MCPLCAALFYLLHKHRGVLLPATAPPPSCVACQQAHTLSLWCRCHPPRPSPHHRHRHDTLPSPPHTLYTCRGMRWCKREGAGGPAWGGIVRQEGTDPPVRASWVRRRDGWGWHSPRRRGHVVLPACYLAYYLACAEGRGHMGEVGGATDALTPGVGQGAGRTAVPPRPGLRAAGGGGTGVCGTGVCGRTAA